MMCAARAVWCAPSTGYMVLASRAWVWPATCAPFIIPILGGAGVLGLRLGERRFRCAAALCVAAAGAVCTGARRAPLRASRPATTSSPSSSSRCCATGCSARCGGSAPRSSRGATRANLISVITSDIELLEVFYAHTSLPRVLIAPAGQRPDACACSSGWFHRPSRRCWRSRRYLAVGGRAPAGGRPGWARGDAGHAHCARRAGALARLRARQSARPVREILQYGAGAARRDETEPRAPTPCAGAQAAA